MARRVLRPSTDSTPALWSAWGNSLVRLVRLYSDEFLWEQAWEVAETFADAQPSGWGLSLVALWEQIEIIDQLCQARDFVRAQALARTLLRDVESRRLTDRPSLRDLSVALERVGELERELGHRATALEAFRRGLEIRERISQGLRRDAPEPTRPQRLPGAGWGRGTGVGASRGGVGRVSAGPGDPRAYRQGLRRDAPEPTRPRPLSGSGWGRGTGFEASRGGAGRISSESGNPRAICRDYGQTPESLRDLSLSLDRVGDLELALEHREAALDASRRALEISERICRDYGRTPENLRDLSSSLGRVGVVELALRHREAALVAYRRGLEISERICRDYGETPESLRGIVVLMYNLALVEKAVEDNASAIAHLRRAGELTQSIFDRGWGLPQHESDRRSIEDLLRDLEQ